MRMLVVGSTVTLLLMRIRWWCCRPVDEGLSMMERAVIFEALYYIALHA
jgi:hypothetical protein